MTRVGAIDCGTNTIKLLVADLDAATGAEHQLVRELRIVRLGQNSPSAATTSSPRGFTPGPCARDWPASTCRHFTRVGMPPAEMPAISGTWPISSR